MSELFIVLTSATIGTVVSILATNFIHGRKSLLRLNFYRKDVLAVVVYFLSTAIFSASMINLGIEGGLWIYLLLHLFIFVSLLYLAIWDIYTLTIPDRFTNYFLLGVVLVNLIAGILEYIFFVRNGMPSLFGFQIGSLGNIISGIALGAIIFALHRLTKGKGIGDGDIFIYSALGFVLGLPLGLGFFVLSCLIGGFMGLVLILMNWNDRSRILQLKIPLMPVILFGYVITLLVQNYINVIFAL